MADVLISVVTITAQMTACGILYYVRQFDYLLPFYVCDQDNSHY